MKEEKERYILIFHKLINLSIISLLIILEILSIRTIVSHTGIRVNDCAIYFLYTGYNRIISIFFQSV